MIKIIMGIRALKTVKFLRFYSHDLRVVCVLMIKILAAI